MGRKAARQNGMRAQIAAAAARIMAEEGIDDFALAKRKAAKRLGAADSERLPGNDEIEAELRDYLALYQAEEHPERIIELRRVALDAMRTLERFSPYLTGAVLAGLAGPYAEIDLQLFPESSKEVELFLLDHDLDYEASDERRYSGDRARAVAVIALTWQGVPLRLSVFDPRDERAALKTTLAGRVSTRAGITEVAGLVADPGQGGEMKEGRRQILILGAAGMAAAAAGFLAGPALLSLGGGSDTKALRSARFADLEGKPRAFAEWSGKVLVCNFWATWCAPCREEIPLLMAARQKYAPSGIEIVGIAIDNASKVRQFSSSLNIPYPLLIAEAEGLDLMRELGNEGGGLPYTVVTGRSGKLVHRKLGALKAEELDAILAPLAKG